MPVLSATQSRLEPTSQDRSYGELLASEQPEFEAVS